MLLSSLRSVIFPPASGSIPEPHGKVPMLGHALVLAGGSPVQTIMGLAREHGPLFRMHFPEGKRVLFATSAEVAKELCDEARFQKFIYGPLFELRALVGDALFTAHPGEKNWAKAHRLLTPAFGEMAMQGYFEMMSEVVFQVIDRWERLNADESIQVADDMTRLTLDTIALCGFGYRFNSFYRTDMHPFVDHMLFALAESDRMAKRFEVQKKLMVKSRREFAQSAKFMGDVVDQIIAERKTRGDKGEKDLLGRMLGGVDEVTGEGLDDVNIRQQIITFLIAGHETTSGMLSFAIYHLLQDPEAMRKAREEVDEVMGPDPEARLSFRDLSKLTYLQQVFKETLRIWPTAPAFGLEPIEDTVILGKYPVKRGEGILYMAPSVHRDPEAWGPGADRFDPDRFSPENEASIPDYAYKPFGFGQRACIGRRFAMQEALLMLATALHRFDFVGDPSYQLAVKETLTLKPEGLTLKVKRRVPRTAPEAHHGAPVEAQEAPKQRNAASQRALRVLYGSNMGASEGFARQMASFAEERGGPVVLSALDEGFREVQKGELVVIVCSSYNGHPPRNAELFCEALQSGQFSAEGIEFAVFGCGNRDWKDTFQAVPRLIDEKMESLGGKRALPRGEADASGDFMGAFEAWCDEVWAFVDENAGDAGRETADVSLYKVELEPKTPSGGTNTPLVEGFVVLENRELVSEEHPQRKSKRHLEISLPEGEKYEVGDHLGVMPVHDSGLVSAVLDRFGLSPEQRIVLRQTRGGRGHLPVGVPITCGALLGQHVELTEPATRRQIRKLAEHTPCPPEKMQLLRMCEDESTYLQEILEPKWSVFGLMKRFESCALPFDAYLEMLPALKPRIYSISSSPTEGPDRLSITVSVLKRSDAASGEEHTGVCSGFLDRLAPGESLRGFVRPPHVPLKHDPASSESLIMICAGTGLAPFRGFVQERMSRLREGRNMAEAVLFFGCDRADWDFLYREELEAAAEAGAISLEVAFSRGETREFVQDRLARCEERVWRLIQGGAKILLCGDGKGMAPGVKEALKEIYRKRSGNGDAAAWLASLEAEHKLVADVWS